MSGIERAAVTLEQPALQPASSRRLALGGFPLAVYIARRLIVAALTLLAVSFMVFAAMELLPGDVAARVLGRNATPQAVAQLTKELGLDRPFLERYLSWLGAFVRGDFGSLVSSGGASGTTVSDLLRSDGLNSVILAGVTMIVMVPVTVLVGTVSAVRAGRPLDHLISALSFVLVSVPEFVLGTFLIYVLAIRTELLPPLSILGVGESPLARPETLVLPVLTLLLGLVAFAARFLRAGMLDVLRSEFIESARLNGFSESRVVWRIALRSSLVPTVQILAMLFPYLIGGLVIVETVFSYPGIGSAFARGVLGGDVRLVQAIAVIGAAITVISNLAADLMVMALVPKLRPGAIK